MVRRVAPELVLDELINGVERRRVITPKSGGGGGDMVLEGDDLLGGVIKGKAERGGALDPRMLNRMLPSAREEAEKAQFLADMFSTTTRAGAGGTKAGLPGIRPSGGKAASSFLENYTGTGRYKHPDRPFSKGLVDPKHRQLGGETVPVKIYIPQNVCFACMQTDRPIGTKEKPSGMVDMYPYFNDRPDLGLKGGEVVICTLCQSCVEKHNAKLSRTVLEEMKDIIVKEWMVRIFVNRENYIRACRTSQGDDHPIYVKEDSRWSK